MKINKKSSLSRPKKILIVLVAVCLLGGGVYAWMLANNPQATPAAPAGVKLKPATKEEKEDSRQRKEEALKEKEQGPNSPPAVGSKKQVTVTITSADQNGVYSNVTGVFEEGGTCSAVFTQDSTVVTRTSAGFANVSYTQCAPIMPNLPNTNPWSVVVSYQSATAEGTSQSQTF